MLILFNIFGPTLALDVVVVEVVAVVDVGCANEERVEGEEEEEITVGAEVDLIITGHEWKVAVASPDLTLTSLAL